MGLFEDGSSSPRRELARISGIKEISDSARISRICSTPWGVGAERQPALCKSVRPELLVIYLSCLFNHEENSPVAEGSRKALESWRKIKVGTAGEMVIVLVA